MAKDQSQGVHNFLHGARVYLAGPMDFVASREAFAKLQAPMGVFAVQGDVDPWPWEQRFLNLGIRTSSTTTTFAVAPLELVGLSLADSSDCPSRVSTARASAEL